MAKYKLPSGKIVDLKNYIPQDLEPIDTHFEQLDDDDYPFIHFSSGDALDGYGSISAWEDANGRGFWGNSTTGYHYDKDVNN